MLKKAKKLGKDLTVTGLTLGAGIQAAEGSTTGVGGITSKMGTMASIGTAGIITKGVMSLDPYKKKKKKK